MHICIYLPAFNFKTYTMKLISLYALIFAFLIHAAQAQCVMDQTQLLSVGGRSARNLPGYYEGQSFMPEIGGLLCEVDMLMFVSMSGSGTLNVYSGNGIEGSLLTSQPVTVNVVSNSSSEWQNWTLDAPPVLNAGEAYSFQFVPTQGGGLPDPYGVNVESSDAYAGGNDLWNTGGELAFRVYVDAATQIEETHIESPIQIFPNPAMERIQINGANKDGGLALVYDASGKLMHECLFAELNSGIDVSQWPNGMYVISLPVHGLMLKFIKTVVQ